MFANLWTKQTHLKPRSEYIAYVVCFVSNLKQDLELEIVFRIVVKPVQ
jgi:hypothetical protein